MRIFVIFLALSAVAAASFALEEVIESTDLSSTDFIPLVLENQDDKRSDWSRLRGSWGKRDWSKLRGSWGKRQQPHPIEYIEIFGEDSLLPERNQIAAYLEDVDVVPLKRSSWSKTKSRNGHSTERPTYRSPNNMKWPLRGSWGKRAGDWSKLRGTWGKRGSDWSQLRGSWGKKSLLGADLIPFQPAEDNPTKE